MFNLFKKKVVTRFPPSPTGPLHVGNVRTALFNYYFARQNGGKFVVRVEDTDKARSKKEYELGMLSALEWLGIKKDNEEILHQSERTEVYKKYLKQLIDSGKAYISQETEGENKEVVRFRNPKVKITFKDLIRGEVTMDTTDLGDFIIARNVNDPVYHMAVVVDDFEQGITHVIRGEDHISNTPRQILIQEALGAPRPVYAHLPLILATDRSKLSKRKHGESVSLDFYRSQGYLPEAIVNFESLLGFNPTGEQEIYSLDQFIKLFDFSKVQKGGAIFNVEKLNWFNKYYIGLLPTEEFKKHAEKFAGKPLSDSILSLLKEKISFFGEIPSLLETEFAFITNWEINKKNISEKTLVNPSFSVNDPEAKQKTKNYVKEVIDILSNIDSFKKDSIKEALWPFADQKGRGNVLWPMRFALSGQPKSPDPFIISEILGKEETLKRLTSAYEAL